MGEFRRTFTHGCDGWEKLDEALSFAMDVFDVIGLLESNVSSWVEGQTANALKGSGSEG